MKNVLIGTFAFFASVVVNADMSQKILPDLSGIEEPKMELFERVGSKKSSTGMGKNLENYEDQMNQSIAFMRAAKACFESKDVEASAKRQEITAMLKEYELESDFEDLFLNDEDYLNQSEICKSMRQDSIAKQMNGYAEAMNLSADTIANRIKSRDLELLKNMSKNKSAIGVRSIALTGILRTAKQKADQQIAAAVEKVAKSKIGKTSWVSLRQKINEILSLDTKSHLYKRTLRDSGNLDADLEKAISNYLSTSPIFRNFQKYDK